MSIAAAESEKLPPDGDVAAMDTWAYQCNDGSDRVSQVVITLPRRQRAHDPTDEDAAAGHWQCLVFIEHEMSGPQSVLGIGPVDTLMRAAHLVAAFAHRVYHLTPRAQSQSSGIGTSSTAASEPATAANWLPELERIEDPIADDVWTYTLSNRKPWRSRVMVGRPQPIPNDAHGDWYCPLWIERPLAEVEIIIGVGPVDALINAMRMLDDFCRDVRDLRREQGATIELASR